VRHTGTTVIVVTHDPEVGARMGRTVTIRDGRVGAQGHSGVDFSVIGRDGSVHLPPEILARFPAGTLLHVRERPDGTIALIPAQAGTPVTGSGGPTGGFPTVHALPVAGRPAPGPADTVPIPASTPSAAAPNAVPGQRTYSMDGSIPLRGDTT
jgi:hypothetical protein